MSVFTTRPLPAGPPATNSRAAVVDLHAQRRCAGTLADTAPLPVTRSTRKMSPSAREPKKANGPRADGDALGQEPVRKANSVGKAADPLAAVARWSAAVEAAPAGMATTIAAITPPSAIVNRRRRYVMGSLPSPPVEWSPPLPTHCSTGQSPGRMRPPRRGGARISMGQLPRAPLSPTEGAAQSGIVRLSMSLG